MTPQISVIVLRGWPDDDLAACLEALAAAATAGPAAEILVVGEGGGPPGAVPNELAVRWIGRGTGDVATAWNAGAEAASGEILLFLRADVVPVADLLARHVAIHGRSDPVVGLGRVRPTGGSHPLALLGPVADPEAQARDLPGCVGQTLSVPAAVFREAGGFTEGLAWGAKVDLIHRLRGSGVEARWIEGTAGRRAAPTTAAGAVRERFAAGRGSVELYRRHRALLPQLELGGFASGQPPALWLRRLLLALGGPVIPPALGRLLPTPRLRERWLRFQHEYHFWRGARRALRGDPVWRSLARPPVVLMYHAIGRPGERPGCYIVPIERFRRQLQWLTRLRYRVIGLEELLAYRRDFRPPPPRSVVITFDDGYADNAELALPELRARGFKATFFLVSGCLGGRNSWDSAGELAGRPMLSWDQARSLLASEMEIGAHTRSHPALPELPENALGEEVGGSRRDLEAGLGREVRTFAYPFGRVSGPVTAAVAAAGYEAACCSRSGVNDPAVPALLLRRLEVRGTDSLARFALGVHRGWVARRRRP
ncbi:MAG TPA: polysaccharide deacetylase family protein [Gemmatimonadales bacterium]